MVAGPFTGKEDQKHPGPSKSGLAIRSTSYFDSISPHFSRQRQPSSKSMPVPVPSQEGEPFPPSVGSSGDLGGTPAASGGGIASTSRGYRPPPPGYYHPYGYPGGPHYGGPPPPGYHPHHGQPPPGYPHHPHSHPSAYSPGYPGGRPVYPGYYEGAPPPPGYPMQHSRDGRSKTPPYSRNPLHGSTSRPTSSSSSSRRASPVGRRQLNRSSPDQPMQPQQTKETGDDTPPQASPENKIADEVETERLRQAALEDISPTQVEPIKTAFHFFVMDMRDSLRPMAEAEVRKTLPEGQPLSAYLVNSNLNGRIMKAWEDLSDEERQACMAKEEADRRRFMEEDEIASRHCATLTARNKSPKTPERRTSNFNCNGSDSNSRRSSPAPSPTASMTNSQFRGSHASPAPSPVSRLVGGPSNSMDDEKKTDDSVTTPYVNEEHKDDKDVTVNKRASPDKAEPETESPPKRNRVDQPAESTAEAS